MIDFTFVRAEVAHLYGHNGNESIDPTVIMKMMFLLFFDNVSSERELMHILGERLDYLWFLGFGIDDPIPDHSVLSKARKKWGPQIFEEFFTRIVWQCVQTGLVGGDKIHMDGSLIDANASKNSVVKSSPAIIASLKVVYGATEEKLTEVKDKESPRERKKYYKKTNDRLMSTTDPDAAIVRKGSLASRPRYKNHRVVDDKQGVITAIETTAGDIEENLKAMDLIDEHESKTNHTVKTVVADAQYGTVSNMVKCAEREIRCHMADLSKYHENTSSRQGIFKESDFKYSSDSDTYECPAGHRMKRRKNKKARLAYEYSVTQKECRLCDLRMQCTRASHGGVRTLKRHYHHEALEIARAQAVSRAALKDRGRRKWLMEGSFADAANNHGFKRARWRRLLNQTIQNNLIATIQNIRILIKAGEKKRKAVIQNILPFVNDRFFNLNRMLRFEIIFTRLSSIKIAFGQHAVKT